MASSTPPWRVIEAPGLEVQAGQPGQAPSPDAGSNGRTTSGPTGLRLGPVVAAAGALAVSLALIVVAVMVAMGGQRGITEVRSVSGTARPGAAGPPVASVAPASAAPTADGVVVEVAGAVLRPGVYTLHRGARVGDAITAAGGYSPRVAADQATLQLNLAAPLKDGQQVRVPSRDDPTAPPLAVGQGPAGDAGGAAGGAPGAGGPLDLNRASAAELEGLPGIGAVTAGKIVAARASQPFAAVDDLLTRKLVSAKVMDQVRSLVTVR